MLGTHQQVDSVCAISTPPDSQTWSSIVSLDASICSLSYDMARDSVWWLNYHWLSFFFFLFFLLLDKGHNFSLCFFFFQFHFSFFFISYFIFIFFRSFILFNLVIQLQFLTYFFIFFLILLIFYFFFLVFLLNKINFKFHL